MWVLQSHLPIKAKSNKPQITIKTNITFLQIIWRFALLYQVLFFFFFDQVHFQVMCFVVWADSVHMCLVYYQALIKTKVYKGIMSASRSKVFLAFILVLVYFSFGNLIFQTRPLACLYLHCSEPVRKKGWRSTTAENETRMCLERELCWYLKSLCLTYSPEGRCFISYSSMFCEYRCV